MLPGLKKMTPFFAPRSQPKASTVWKKRRPCADKWPEHVCECDKQLGAFNQTLIYERVVSVLKRADIEFVHDVFKNKTTMAVRQDALPHTKSLLVKAGIAVEETSKQVAINEYDFPPFHNGTLLEDRLPTEAPVLKAVPHYFCNERRAEALEFALTITAYVDFGDIRCFLSPSANTRTRSISLQSMARKPRPRKTNDIDVVITTVDGEDPEWKKRFLATVSAFDQNRELAKAVNAARYTNHDELRYVLRSIYYYAPYVRNIYIVTDQQRPDWLDPNSNRVQIIDHTDIMGPSHRPTFNSESIESVLWKIPGLSEKFIYFNDDFFLMGPTSETTFFTSNELPKLFRSPRRLPEIPADWASNYTTHAHIRTASAIVRKSPFGPTYKFKHVPYACSKSTLARMEGEFPEELRETRESRVRSVTSFSTISFLYPNFALSTQQAVLSRIKSAYVDLSWEDWETKLSETLQRTNLTCACINDSHDSVECADMDNVLSGMLQSRFPARAPWERLAGQQRNDDISKRPSLPAEALTGSANRE